MINDIPNQAINFSPNDLLECRIFGASYCQYINGSNEIAFQVQLGEYTGINITDGFDVVSSGSTTGTGANQLIDAGANFVTEGVVAGGATAFNISGGAAALVTVVNTTALTLSSNIFTTSPQVYRVLNVALAGSYSYNLAGRITLNSGGSFSTGTILTNGSIYRLDLNVISNTGQLEISGGTPLGEDTTETTGEQSFYFRADIAQQVQVTMTGGSAGLEDFAIYQMDEPTFKVFDPDNNEIYSGQPGLEIWNNTAMFKFSPLDLTGVEVGCYTFRIFGLDDVSYLATNCIQIANGQPCDVIKLTWTNNNNAFGLEYANLDYTQAFWAKGVFNNPTYDLPNRVLELSNGGTYLLNAQRKKQISLQLYEMPAYMHDALSVGIVHRTFDVNGTQYRFDGEEYSPVWRNTSKNAPVILEFRLVTENNRNNNC